MSLFRQEQIATPDDPVHFSFTRSGESAEQIDRLHRRRWRPQGPAGAIARTGIEFCEPVQRERSEIGTNDPD
ncbi:hypothetical protein [Bradyrhizobium sp.]|uniref:hypothetical protein n=1 Tax=Bradyrhizobium sp. TaxID=376 RepID=UPI001EBF5CCF|nr:hypothetical protein [Bradyrhizobium sp.]MBV9980101.1 hypothetical protein [Bradyrhizobium sp.]